VSKIDWFYLRRPIIMLVVAILVSIAFALAGLVSKPMRAP